jgi:GTP-binding protein Era
LEGLIYERLPENDHFFDEDQITDKSERFLASEIIREKLMRQLGKELPYSTTVEIERYKEEGETTHIHALIYVERDSQKNIVIGQGGKRLKLIGSEARRDIEALVDNKVMLSLWVKVKKGWSDDDSALKSLGF